MEKNGILLERFPIGSQKATKVKKKKKNLKKANHQTFCVSHNELWSFAFRPQLVAANPKQGHQRQKKRVGWEIWVLLLQLFLLRCCLTFFLGGRWFHTSWPSIYNGRNWRLIRRSGRHPPRNSFRLFRFLTSDCDRDQRVQHLRLSLDSKFHPIVTVGSNDFEFFKISLNLTRPSKNIMCEVECQDVHT